MTVPPERSSPGRWRLLTAFAILPIVQALVAFVAFPLVWRLGDHGALQPVDPDAAAREFAIVTGILGLFVTVAGAVPVVYWLMRRSRISLARLCWRGSFCSAFWLMAIHGTDARSSGLTAPD